MELAGVNRIGLADMAISRAGGGWGPPAAASGLAAITAAPGIQDGDSLTSFSYQADPSRWGLPLTRLHPKMMHNFGTPNDTLTDMLARQSTTLAGAAEVGAGWVMFRAGTNGVGTGDFATKYAQLVDAFITAGLFVFCLQIPPTSSGGATKVTQNGLISDICAARPNDTRYIADSSIIADGSYNVLAGRTEDGIHHNAVGQFETGVAQAALMTGFFGTDARVVDSGGVAGQWVNNPLMTGTGGSVSGGTGTVPDSWGIAAIGASTAFVASIVAADGADPVQVPWLRVELTACGGSGHSWEITGQLTHPSISASFTSLWSVDTVVEVRLVTLDTTNLQGIESGPSVSRTFIQTAPRARLQGNGTISKQMVMRTSYKRSAATAYSADAIDFMVKIESTGAFGSSAGYVDIRCASARSVTV